MTQFYPLTINSVEKENNNTIVVEFEVPEQWQLVFAYKAGQYLTLKTIINGEEVRRSYSLCSSPINNNWKVAIKKVEGGLFSNYAHNFFTKGMQIDVLPPNGKFYTPLVAHQTKQYVAFVAGSGITPILSLITTTLAIESDSSFTLVYGNKNSNSIIFKEAIEALKNKYVNRLNVIHILSKEFTDATIHYGRIDADKCHILYNKLLPKADDYFICGPEKMILTVQDFLLQQGINKLQIHFELFGTEKKPPAVVTTTTVNQKNSQSQVAVIIDGRTIAFTLPYNGTPILDAALQNGADLPYACKGGVCCTCRAKLIEGKVNMAVNYALEEAEVTNGFILTCQSTPITEKVVISFDIK